MLSLSVRRVLNIQSWAPPIAAALERSEMDGQSLSSPCSQELARHSHKAERQRHPTFVDHPDALDNAPRSVPCAAVIRQRNFSSWNDADNAQSQSGRSRHT